MLIGALAKIALLSVVTTHAPAVHVTVHPGDSLSKIAVAQCGGKVNDWTGIYAHNKAVIGSNPNLIQPGMRLKVVCKDPHYLLVLGHAPAPAAPSVTHQASSYACGDGDGDGYDMPCSDLAGAAAPVQAAQPAAPAATYGSASYGGAPGSFQACVIARESGGNPSAVNASSGAGGLYQFLQSTWTALGFPGSPAGAPVSEQNAAFAKEYAQSGTSAWGPYDGC